MTPYERGYIRTLKTAGLLSGVKDVATHYGKGLREAVSPILGPTPRMMDRQEALRRVAATRRHARDVGSDPDKAIETMRGLWSPRMERSLEEAMQMGDVYKG